MDIDRAKQEVDLLNYIESSTGKTFKSVGNSTYRASSCPICDSTNGFNVNLNPSNSNYPLWKCFKSGKGGSIIDFILEYEGLDIKTATKRVIELAGGSIEPMRKEQTSNSKQNENKNYSSLTEKYYSDVDDMIDYFKARGISKKLIDKYKLGYDSKYNGITLPVYKGDKVVFITKRLLDNNKMKYYNEGSPAPFNIDILADKEVKDIFITEGIFDALSLEELGYKAIATNSTSNIDKFFKEYKDQLKEKNVFIAVDNDVSNDKIKDILKLSNVNRFEFDNSYNDINEYLSTNKEELEQELKNWKNTIKDKDFNNLFIENYFDTLISNRDREIIKTPFNNFNNILGGGIYPGLITIGAISSLGKTTFCLQLADYIAKSGFDVLFFTLEQSRMELTSKSITRIFNKEFEKDMLTISTRELMNGDFKGLEQQVKQSINQYKPISEHIAFIEGNFDYNVIDIERRIEEHINIRGTKPVIFVDYLQILNPAKGYMSDKQAVDYNVSALKKISRDFDTPVFVISSFNRANYNKPASFEHFKESGGIEYSADVTLALQFRDIGEGKNVDIDELKSKDIRDIELVMLKNRNGIATGSSYFEFNPLINEFTETK